MIITVGGHIGSGKSTVCKILIDRYLHNYSYSYTGQIFRDMAMEKNLSIEEFYKQMSADPEGEKAIDARQAERMNAQNYLIVDGRMAAFQKTQFDMLKILLIVEPEEGARRTMLREKKGKSLTQTLTDNIKRASEERARYRSLYSIEDFLDPKHYDVVVDTTKIPAKEVAHQLYMAL